MRGESAGRGRHSARTVPMAVASASSFRRSPVPRTRQRDSSPVGWGAMVGVGGGSATMSPTPPRRGMQRPPSLLPTPRRQPTQMRPRSPSLPPAYHGVGCRPDGGALARCRRRHPRATAVVGRALQRSRRSHLHCRHHHRHHHHHHHHHNHNHHHNHRVVYDGAARRSRRARDGSTTKGARGVSLFTATAAAAAVRTVMNPPPPPPRPPR